jgi:hypothetical protein
VHGKRPVIEKEGNGIAWNSIDLLDQLCLLLLAVADVRVCPGRAVRFCVSVCHTQGRAEGATRTEDALVGWQQVIRSPR